MLLTTKQLKGESIETLMDSISQIITDYKTELVDEICFTTIDIKYAYSQLV